jgi:gluconokinase
MSARAAIIVMGVTGCGKSTFGQALAAALGAPYLEGDALHPATNIARMSAGIALTDADRAPWLDLIAARLAVAPGLVAACSALKRSYRDRLRAGVGQGPERAPEQEQGPRLRFIHLKGERALIEARLAARQGHFMAPSLIDSQFAALEDPAGEPGVITLDIARGAQAALDDALAQLADKGGRDA